ncbi:MAG: hypothetical protein AABY22_36935 [Nanoarchaeota archaeon]
MAEKSKTWEYEGKTFMKCPECDSPMLAKYTSHKCGWGQEKKEEVKNVSLPDNSKIVGISISYAKDLCVAGMIKKEDIGATAKGFIELHKELMK